MKERMIVWCAAVLCLAVVAAAAEKAAEKKEPTGFGEAKFGMTADEVRGKFPKLEELTKNLGAVPVGGPYITRYVLWKQPLPGLSKPGDVEMRFWKGKLWVIIVYCGENGKDAMLAALTKAYGPATNTDVRYPSWIGEKSSLVSEPNETRYTMNDNAMSKEAQVWFAEVLRQGLAGKVMSGASPQGTPSGATPAAAPAASPAVPATPPAATPVP